MRGQRSGIPTKTRLFTSLLAAMVWLPALGQPVTSAGGQPDLSGQIPATQAGVENAGAMTVYVDPNTGAFLKEPAPGHVPMKLSRQLQNALSTSHEGLVEVPSSVPGGGIKIDLQGRFQSPLVVIIDADGKPKMQHLSELPKSDVGK